MADKIYVCIGANNHSEKEREINDYYATDPKAIELLLEKEKFSNHIWECAVGEGHLAKVLEKNGYNVIASDIIDRGYPDTRIIDFLNCNKQNLDLDIITNPPYKQAQQFVEKAIDVIEQGHKVAMFLKLTFLESQSRRKLFEKNPPKLVYVFSKRVYCAMNGDFDKYKTSAIAYAWFVWEKGFTGNTIVQWIN